MPLFDKLSDADLDALLARANLRRFAIGEAVFEQGTLATHFFLLLHGRLKVTQVTADGQQIIVRMVYPGDIFGFAKALQRDDYPGTPTAAAESVVIFWPADVWDVFIKKSPIWLSTPCKPSVSACRRPIPVFVRWQPRRSSAVLPTLCSG